MEGVDRRLERAGKKGHRYVRRSFERRKEMIRSKWLSIAAEILQDFQSYLRERVGC